MNNDHLTSEQIEDLLADPNSRDWSQHLSDCNECSAELDELRAAMEDLRYAAIASAEHHRRVAVLPVISHRMPRTMWTLLAVAALLCVAGPLAIHRAAVHPMAVVQGPMPITVSDASQQKSTESDEQLMSNVQADLSSGVPAAMLPLAEDAASSSASASTYTSTDSARSSAKENE